ncbi:MAG TPA: hypothetical protein VGP91_07080, partial [Actinoplanes sp.]|nr:hypothetical protein [Actinoplanes sp.]
TDGTSPTTSSCATRRRTSPSCKRRTRGPVTVCVTPDTGTGAADRTVVDEGCGRRAVNDALAALRTTASAEPRRAVTSGRPIADR